MAVMNVVKRHVLDSVLVVCALVLTLVLVLALFSGITGSLTDISFVRTMEHPEEWAGYYRRAQLRLLLSVVGGLFVAIPGLWFFWSRFGRWLRRP